MISTVDDGVVRLTKGYSKQIETLNKKVRGLCQCCT